MKEWTSSQSLKYVTVGREYGFKLYSGPTVASNAVKLTDTIWVMLRYSSRIYLLPSLKIYVKVVTCKYGNSDPSIIECVVVSCLLHIIT